MIIIPWAIHWRASYGFSFGTILQGDTKMAIREIFNGKTSGSGWRAGEMKSCQGRQGPGMEKEGGRAKP